MSTAPIDKPKTLPVTPVVSTPAEATPVATTARKSTPSGTTTTVETTPASTPDRMEPTNPENAQKLAAWLSRRDGRQEVTPNACSIDGSTVIAVRPEPGQGPRQGAGVLNGLTGTAAAVCSVPGTDAAVLGARTALDEVRGSRVDTATLKLVENGGAQYTVVVPGNVTSAEAVIAGRIAKDREDLYRQYPSMRARHQEIVDAMKRDPALAGQNFDIAALGAMADRLLAREILRSQNFTQNTDSPVTIAMPTVEQQFVMYPAVVAELERTGQINREAAAFLSGQASIAQSDVRTANADMFRRVAPYLGRFYNTELLTRMIAMGRIPANLSDAELRQWVERLQHREIQRMERSQVYSGPAERQQRIGVMRQQAPEVRRSIDHRHYQEAAREAVTHTLLGTPGAHATFYNRDTGGTVAVTRENVRRYMPSYTPPQSLASYIADSDLVEMFSGTDVAAHGAVASVRQERDRREARAADDRSRLRTVNTFRGGEAVQIRERLADEQADRNIRTRQIANTGRDPGPGRTV